MTDEAAYSRLRQEEADMIRHRRRTLRIGGRNLPLSGLALSGGGIRSATFGLGLLQGMVRAKQFDRIDMISSVSGGGYIGSFLRSLFIPARLRFHAPGDPPIPEAKGSDFVARRNWALRVLAAPAGTKRLTGKLADRDARHFESPGAQDSANPVWWLREHGRYLAPNGGGDYIFALGYIVRAWFAMQYVAVVPLFAIFLFFKILFAWSFGLAEGIQPGAMAAIIGFINLIGGSWFKLSPLMVLPLLVLALALIPLSTSYWSSATLSQWKHNRWEAFMVIWLLGTATLMALWLPWLRSVRADIGGALAWFGFYFAFIQFVAIGGLYAATRKAGHVDGGIYRSEIRRVLTDWLALAIKIMLFLAVLAIIDSLALSLASYARTPAGREGAAGGLAGLAALVPLIVWLVNKLQAWLPRFVKLGRQASNLQRIMPGLVLALGMLAYSIIAIFCAAAAYAIVWIGTPIGAIGQDGTFEFSTPAIHSSLVVLLIVVILALVTGLSSSFLNLSSLHFLYAGRLTRAYLGATNSRRLAHFGAGAGKRSAANVREYDSADAIGLGQYHDKRILAPIHLINATANETQQTASQLVQRDRKGNNLCVSPGGIGLGDDYRTKDQLRAQNAEPLAVGKWMAVSGAAASTGMGDATSLGAALLLTFANVRLGYWWFAPELGGRMPLDTLDPSGKRADTRKLWKWRDLFETQSYLLNEAAAEYSRVDKLRLNLSDGGHFENSGAYELIRRRLPVIIVSDAAADPAYEFEDFSNLTRKARIDLGAEIRCLERTELSVLSPAAAAFCGLPADFRTPQAQDRRCAVVCRIDYDDGAPPSLMIVIKPRVPTDAAPDIAAYHRACPRFPQEPTADQFFGEAQWESYRRLGETLGERLFESPFLDELLRVAEGWRRRRR